MRRLAAVAVLLALAVPVRGGVIMATRGVAACTSSSTSWTVSWATDDTANWTNESACGACPIAWDDPTDSAYWLGAVYGFAYRNGSGAYDLPSASQWLCSKFTDVLATDLIGLMLRHPGGTNTQAYVIRTDGTDFEWYSVETTADAGSWSDPIDTSTSVTVSDNDYVCMFVTGTGASTTVEIWKDTASFGDFDNAAWDAQADWHDILTVATPPATYADTGLYVGLFAQSGFFANTTAGACP